MTRVTYEGTNNGSADTLSLEIADSVDTGGYNNFTVLVQASTGQTVEELAIEFEDRLNRSDLGPTLKVAILDAFEAEIEGFDPGSVFSVLADDEHVHAFKVQF